ncbi:MAG: formate C-acetyltransferase/glycerol dehydratase family glycyl radical enzyme [Bacteroidales bacterium]|nr:formate C-acetyltransferase/glycerol dehydratase family glycyl radical enzyme [Bacteroidales bacterium]
MLSQRIKNLRNKSLSAIPYISAERALLITEYYKQPGVDGLPKVLQRAGAFEYILNNKELYIDKDELFVGERGPEPKAVPTYPEVCIHSLQDLEILNSREKVSYKVGEGVMKAYNDIIIPFWKGKSLREQMFSLLPPEWIDAYQSGLFTEFQEQRAPGHTAGGKALFSYGMLDLTKRIDKNLHKIEISNDEDKEGKIFQLQAMKTVALALIAFANRYAEAYKELAEKETDGVLKEHYNDLALLCQRVPAHAPQTFREAIQHYWFIHIGVVTELNPWDSFNPGRLDQHLYPFYQKETGEGTLSPEQAKELLQAFWVKFNNHPAPPKTGVTARESNTYTDFTLVNVGGLDENGEDAANELSFLILDVIEEMRLLQPGSMVQISHKNPDALIHRALGIIKTGFGQPSLFNSDAIVEELCRQGKSRTDAYNGGASGCVEAGAFGTEAYWLTGYFNLPKVLELTLYNGFDPVSQRQLGPKTGSVNDFISYTDFFKAFENQLKHFVNIKIQGNLIIESLIMEELQAPFLSLFIEDCIDNAKDYNAGGARYNTSYIQGVGLGSIADSLTAIKYHVFDKKDIAFAQLIALLENDFAGNSPARASLIYETPKYGNGDKYADQQAKEVFDLFFDLIDGIPTARGGHFHIDMLPTTCHVYFGAVTGATPDGRKAFAPLSEGISPVQGADRNGPTAVIQSVACFDHLKTGGTLLNQKFAPDFFKDQNAINNLTALIRVHFKKMNHHIQFNVVDAETLKQARIKPEDYADLIVRVAGYSDYFNHLTPELQEEIILRTMHQGI